MKLWIPMSILALSIFALCIWDGNQTKTVFSEMENRTSSIYNNILISEIDNKKLKDDIFELNDYWTEKMDTLCISISRKDLQPISDYLQYLYASCISNNQEDAITYSRLLYYNVVGLKETTGINIINFL